MRRVKLAIVFLLLWGTIIGGLLGVLYLVGGGGSSTPDNCVHPGGSEWC